MKPLDKSFLDKGEHVIEMLEKGGDALCDDSFKQLYAEFMTKSMYVTLTLIAYMFLLGLAGFLALVLLVIFV